MLAIAAIGLMALDQKKNFLDHIRVALSMPLYPVMQLASVPVDAGGWVSQNFTSQQELQEEVETLRTQQLLLKAQLQRLAALETENIRLRELLQSSKRTTNQLLVAELLAVDLDPFSHRVVISKGKRHGIYEGQPLLDADGIIGQVVQVNMFSSAAMLISDPNHATPVQINRNGMRAIAIGTGSPRELDLPHIPNNADVKVGDLLVTSGLGGRFPTGYPVGTIKEIRTNPALPFADIVVEPAAHLERSREVLLVWPNRPEDNNAAEEIASAPIAKGSEK